MTQPQNSETLLHTSPATPEGRAELQNLYQEALWMPSELLAQRLRGPEVEDLGKLAMLWSAGVLRARAARFSTDYKQDAKNITRLRNHVWNTLGDSGFVQIAHAVGSGTGSHGENALMLNELHPVVKEYGFCQSAAARRHAVWQHMGPVRRPMNGVVVARKAVTGLVRNSIYAGQAPIAEVSFRDRSLIRVTAEVLQFTATDGYEMPDELRKARFERLGKALMNPRVQNDVPEHLASSETGLLPQEVEAFYNWARDNQPQPLHWWQRG